MDQLNYKGLSAAEVEDSRKKNGANVLAPPVRVPWYIQYLRKFSDPVIRILMIAAILSCVIGDWVEGGGILVAIALATFIAFINEYRAEKEFDLLNQSNDDLPYKVIREGAFVMVPRRDLVVGDVVFVEQGEEIPADALVLEAVNLQLDQSSLTGETDPVEKFPSGHPEIARLGECIYPADKLLRGTPVVEGYGYARLVAVGEHSEIGKTAREASLESDEETPLQKQLEKLSRIIGLVGFVIAATTFGVLVGREIVRGDIVQTLPQWGVTATLALALLVALLRVWLPLITDGLELILPRFRGPECRVAACLIAAAVIAVAGLGGIALGGVWPDPVMSTAALGKILGFFMIAVTLIVVAVPEGLAMSVTLSLAYSMRRMTASNNLVRKMHACETIGAATVICTDKTGTLTRNEMRVYETKFSEDGIDPLIREGIAANSTAFLDANGKVIGNPTEGALLLWLKDRGADYAALRDAAETVDQMTFTTERKFMATLVDSASGKRILYIKGAPEIILAKCAGFGAKAEVEKQLSAYQNMAMRTLGFAYAVCDGVDTCDEALERCPLHFIGIAAISDPVRDDVPAAVAECLSAGIDVKIVTGDTPATAKEIGRQIGLWTAEDTDRNHITGSEFAALSDEELLERVQSLKIMSRARPLDKQRLVRLLQQKGEVVAVTGDGTNDAPALNFAQVGLSMGTGTSVAKEASDITLLDDSFSSIATAVMWGRSLYRNIQRFVLFQLTINFVAIIIVLFGSIFGSELPLTVTQMLWVNLIMDTFAALALASLPPSRSVMREKPRKNSDFIISRPMMRSIVGVGLLFVAVLLGILYYFGSAITIYELSAFFTVFVMLQFWNMFNAKGFGTTTPIWKAVGGCAPFFGVLLLILAGQFIIVTWGGNVFRTVPLSGCDWLTIIGATSLVMWGGELTRALSSRRRHTTK